MRGILTVLIKLYCFFHIHNKVQAFNLCKDNNANYFNPDLLKPEEIILRILKSLPYPHTTTFDKLGSEFSNFVGTSWGNSYKKRYGGLGNFIKSHSSLFDYTNNVDVILKNPDFQYDSMMVLIYF